MAPYFKKYIWKNLKQKKLNITSKMISKPSVATVVGTHFEVNTTSIEVDNQMAIIQVLIMKNIVEDILKDGGVNVNIIIKNFIKKLGLPKPRLAPYHLKMAYQNMIIHGIPYVATFIVLKNNVVDFSYFML
jgi:hypothetical protein